MFRRSRKTIGKVEPIGADGERVVQVPDLDCARLLRAVAELAELEKRVLVWRFGLFGQPELSVRQIATQMNMQPGVVREIERRALSSMRGSLEGTEVAA